MEFFLAWIVLAPLVGLFASSRGRSGLGYFLLALLLSPLLAFIVLLVTKDLNQVAQEEAARRAEAEKREHLRHEVHERNFPERVSSLADALMKLAKLRDAGVLTDQEFQAQKAALLRRDVEQPDGAEDWYL